MMNLQFSRIGSIITALLARSQVLHREERAQTLTEYALLLVFIAIVLIGALTTLGSQLNNFWSQITSALTSAGA